MTFTTNVAALSPSPRTTISTPPKSHFAGSKLGPKPPAITFPFGLDCLYCRAASNEESVFLVVPLSANFVGYYCFLQNSFFYFVLPFSKLLTLHNRTAHNRNQPAIPLSTYDKITT
jgi:hypothetical protein